MKKTPFNNALHRAEGAIASISGGRRSWDTSTLRDCAMEAMAGSRPPFGNSSPEEWEAMANAYAKISARTTEAHKSQAQNL